jgi:hypothetical protein
VDRLRQATGVDSLDIAGGINLVRQPHDQPEQQATPVPRRNVLRSLIGAATGLATLLGLAACGGDDNEDD